MEWVTSKEAIGPEWEMPGGELLKSYRTKDEELLREFAIGKAHTIWNRYEVTPEKEQPQAEQNEQM